MSAGSDLRLIDGRCAGCGAWLQSVRSLTGRCINRDCDRYMVTQGWFRPVSVCGIVREVNEAAAKILDAGA